MYYLKNKRLSLNIENIIKEILSDKEIQDIIGLPNEYPHELIEKVSLQTALKYWNGEIDFSEGDSIMNGVYGYWLYTDKYSKKYEFSDIAWDCFNAFDSGEYIRSEDGPNVNPVKKYTKPQIESLLKKHKLIT